MTELFRDANGSDAPASHIRGSTAICGAFATSGIQCPHVFHAPHKSGLGDHRYHVLHISASSMIGEDYPHLVSPSSRKLTCRIERVRKSYNKVLLQLTERHRMFAKMSALQQDALQPNSTTFNLSFNQWDREMSELMHSAEEKSSKFKHDDIEFSPVVGIWLNRLRIYKHIMRFKSGLVPDPRNLFRACQRADIPQPQTITLDALEASIVVCETQLTQLKQQAPLLRHQHLQHRLQSAQDKEDDDAIREIIRILKREANQKEWRNLRSVTKPRTGGAAIAIKVRTPTGETHYTTQEGVEQGAASVLQERFCLGRRAPMCSGQLFSDIGYIGDTTATRSILEGTYTFPPDTDEPTMFLWKEASKNLQQNVHGATVIIRHHRGFPIFMEACQREHPVITLRSPLRTLQSGSTLQLPLCTTCSQALPCSINRHATGPMGGWTHSSPREAVWRNIHGKDESNMSF